MKTQAKAANTQAEKKQQQLIKNKHLTSQAETATSATALTE